MKAIFHTFIFLIPIFKSVFQNNHNKIIVFLHNMKPFISDHRYYYPERETLDFLRDYFSHFVKYLSGQSLKYLRSRQNVLVFSIPEYEYQNLLNHIKKDEKFKKFQRDISYYKNSFKIIIKNDILNRDEDIHLIFQKNFVFSHVLISIDRLFFHDKDFQWHGHKDDLKDFQRGIIRIVKPFQIYLKQSINLISYASMLDFTFEDNTFQKVKEVVEKSSFEDFQKIDVTFLRKQFSKILTSAKPSTGLILMHQTGLLKWFLPELNEIYGIRINEYDKNDLFHFCIYSCDNISEPDITFRLTGLLYNIGRIRNEKNIKDTNQVSKEKNYFNFEISSAKLAYKILKRFQFPNDLIQRVYFLIRHHSFFYLENITTKALRKFLRKISEQNLQDIISYRLAERKREYLHNAILPYSLRRILWERDKIIEYEHRIKIKDLKVNGEDLKNLGIEPGPIYGEILKFLLKQVEKKILPNEKEILLEEAKNFFKQKIEYETIS